MKKILILFAISIIGTNAACFAQDVKPQYQLAELLNMYYNIKNAFVVGNPADAAVAAKSFVQAANTIDYKVISEGNIRSLVKDADDISRSKDLNKQRSAFSNLSTNIVSVAKAVKLTDKPVYLAYCPMKNAYWLSSEKEIKNPYYGSSMLTCGEVKETL